MNEQQLIEALADKEHASWARWMTYLLSKCAKQEDGSLLIPSDLVKHWQQEIETPYSELPERYKQSDRNEVAHILPLIAQYAKQAENERLRGLLYELANYVSMHIRHTDPALSSLVSEAILASYDPAEDADESTTWPKDLKKLAAL